MGTTRARHERKPNPSHRQGSPPSTPGGTFCEKTPGFVRFQNSTSHLREAIIAICNPCLANHSRTTSTKAANSNMKAAIPREDASLDHQPLSQLSSHSSALFTARLSSQLSSLTSQLSSQLSSLHNSALSHLSSLHSSALFTAQLSHSSALSHLSSLHSSVFFTARLFFTAQLSQLNSLHNSALSHLSSLHSSAPFTAQHSQISALFTALLSSLLSSLTAQLSHSSALSQLILSTFSESVKQS